MSILLRHYRSVDSFPDSLVQQQTVLDDCKDTRTKMASLVVTAILSSSDHDTVDTLVVLNDRGTQLAGTAISRPRVSPRTQTTHGLGTRPPKLQNLEPL